MAFSPLPDLPLIPPSFTSFQIRPPPPTLPDSFPLLFLGSLTAAMHRLPGPAEDVESRRFRSQGKNFCEGQDDKDGDGNLESLA